jgi:FkbM family methyltransferase
LLAWFERNVSPGETWLDIGAHYGYTALALCRLVGGSGRVFAFEPILETAACVETTKQLNGLNQLTVVPLALGADPSVTVVDTSIERGMATHDPSAAGARQLLEVALDTLWPSISGGQPRLEGIKVDVQGMECSVVAGMLGVLRRWHPKLIIELHAGVNSDSVVQQLTAVGYGAEGRPLEAGGLGVKAYDCDRSYLFLPVTGSSTT